MPEIEKKSFEKILKKTTGHFKYDFHYNSENLKFTEPHSLIISNKLNTLVPFFEAEAITYPSDNKAFLKSQNNVNKSISGTVLDDLGAPLPSVSIKVKGTTIGVVSDNNGKFLINVPDNKSILQFSFIGFKTQEVIVGDKTNIIVRLKEDENLLNEVKVVDLGYGNIEKRSDLTGSIGSVNVNDLQKAPISNFEEALAGRVAGVQVLSQDGQPGDGFNIVIRGASSINNSNSPLYVIDGLPIEDPDNNNINPADIASITILKDASSTAIYGSRAANGVVIITTKQGLIGKTKVNYNSFIGSNVALGRIDLMNAVDFVKLQYELDSTYTNTNYFNRTSSGIAIDATRPVYSINDYERAESLDFQDKILQKAPFQNHILTISGGNDKGTKFLFSGSYTDREGVILASGFKRYQGRLNLDQKITDKLKITANLNYTSSKSFGSFPRNQESGNSLANDARNNLFYRVWVWRPTTINFDSPDLEEDPIIDDEPGSSSQSSLIVNPYLSVLNQYNARLVNSFSASTITNYKFNKNLSYRLNASASISNTRSEKFENEFTNSGRSEIYGPNGALSYQTQNNFSLENILNYNKSFSKKTSLNLIALTSQQWRRMNTTAFSATHVLFTNLGVNGLPSGNIQPVFTVNESDANLLGFGTTANFNYLNKYIFKASFRADGSSKFTQGNRWGFFPSGGFAWKISEEGFMKNVNAITNIKFRVNYGETGNNRISDFPYLSPLVPTNTSGYVYNNTYYPGYWQTSLGNRALKWETTSQFDTGLEFSTFSNQLTVEIDYYKKNTRDLLLFANFPLSSGFGRGLTNIGKISNEGLEFTLNAIAINNKNFKWSTNFNVSFNRNKLVELADGGQNLINTAEAKNPSPNYISQVGYPIGMFYGFTYDGVYQYSDFNKSPSGIYFLKDDVIAPNGGLLGFNRADVRPGDPKYKDINGDGVVNDNDQGIIGQSNPKAVGGFNNNFTFKNFDLNMFFQWSYGGQNLNMNRFYLENPATRGLNQFASYNNRWTPENPSNYAPRVGASGTFVSSSRFIENSSFLRFKTLQLAYSLPGSLISKAGIQAFKINASVQNIWTITEYTGSDPEVNTLGTGLTPAYEFSAYPRALTYTIGLNVTF